MNIAARVKSMKELFGAEPAARRASLITLSVLLSGAASLWFFMHLAGLHLPLQAQFAVGWGAAAALIVLKRFDRSRKPPLRIIFVVLCGFLTIRYAVWRTMETLVYTGFWDFLAMLALYLAEMYAIALHALGAFTSIWPLENKIMPLPADASLYPSVDIFIPTYNEPLDIVRVTATAALNIDYPADKLKIFILDDGSTVAKRNASGTSEAAWERHYEFKRLAAGLGVGYITRSGNLKAKAGNLTHAMRHTSSDLILVLDCDHVPARDILKNTAGWFLKDEKVAFVQTPHFFINPNPIEKNMGVFQDAPSENDMFYRGIHPGLDMWNASYFCGSAALLRRKCLEEIGGVRGETITEDCETALSLHSRGYKSVYIPRPMVCGLSPETFDDMIVQKSRWAQGMAQVMVLANPLFAKGLKLYQRLCYFNSCFYWFFGLSRVIFYVAPAAFLLLDLKVYFASVPQVLAYAVPHVIGSFILTGFLYGKYRWPFFSEFFEGIQSLFLIPVVLSVLVNPRKPSFKVTPKGNGLESDRISGFATPFLMLTLVLVAAVPAAVIKWFQCPVYRDITLITLVWCVLNLVLALASFGAFFERKQSRKHHRMWAKGKAQVFLPRLKAVVQAKMDDISLTGIGLTFKLPQDPGPLEHLVLETRNSYGKKFRIEARVQRFVKKGADYVCGCEFLRAGAKQTAETLEFVYCDGQKWADFWSQKTKPASPLWMASFLLRSSVSGAKIFYATMTRTFVMPVTRRAWRLAARLAGSAAVLPAPSEA
ncbi:MAG: UDP-forming cellulose synthase catalytic subunit [Elusimicrobia bacterium]|nr:UDP-forming cellulose synthase catalytic subunit [Elusimicrobiota bacterium]